jgi:GH18 family chitinase
MSGAEGRYKVVAYVPNWIDTSTFVETIDYEKLTHINIAFENPANDDGDLTFNKANEALIASAHNHHIPVLVSIGGGSASENKKLCARYFDLLSTTKRGVFVAIIAAYLVEHNFDGLDVDIEGPAINDDYGVFIESLAKELKPKDKLLTAALSRGYGGSKVPSAVFEHFDFINIMAYDATGPWNRKAAGQHSSLQFSRENVAYWLNRGLPRSKAVLGVPFYGYGFGEAYRNRDYPYSAILSAYSGADQLDEIGNTIWYNGIPTIKAKCQYAVDEGLAGIMIWSLDNDVRGEHSLLSAIDRVLKSKKADTQ